jgi:SAM-dependent methyltransferase
MTFRTLDGDPAPWAPLGAALLDYHRGDHDAKIIVASSLWEDEQTPVAAFYRPLEHALPELERIAIARCRGAVLDLGAGSGRHAVELQAAGHPVVAVDILPEAVAIMRERGVRDPRCGGLESVRGETFDTILMLMHGLGAVGDIRGLGHLLEQLPGLLAPGGALICDSADLATVLQDEAPELLDELTDRDGYLGEVEFALSYGGTRAPSYPWLFIAPDQLEILASAAGFSTEIVARAERGSYLAKLRHDEA